jgi:hypothetical protein
LRHRSGVVAALFGQRSGWHSTYDLRRGLGQRKSPGHCVVEWVPLSRRDTRWWQVEGLD